MLTKDKCALKYIVRSSILMWSYLSSSSSSSKRVKRKELYNKICITHIEFWSIDSQWKWCKREKLIHSYSHPTLCESMSVRWVIVNSKIMISSNLNVSRRSSFNWGHLNVIHHHWPYQTRECLFSFMQYSQLFEEERMFCLLTFVWIWRNDKQNEGGENQWREWWKWLRWSIERHDYSLKREENMDYTSHLFSICHMSKFERTKVHNDLFRSTRNRQSIIRLFQSNGWRYFKIREIREKTTITDHLLLLHWTDNFLIVFLVFFSIVIRNNDQLINHSIYMFIRINERWRW